LFYINFKPSNSNKKKVPQNNPISQIEMEQLSKVNKTLSLKVKPKPKSQPKIQTKYQN
jgi:signal recognition particle subunit SEC65